MISRPNVPVSTNTEEENQQSESNTLEDFFSKKLYNSKSKKVTIDCIKALKGLSVREAKRIISSLGEALDAAVIIPKDF